MKQCSYSDELVNYFDVLRRDLSILNYQNILN